MNRALRIVIVTTAVLLASCANDKGEAGGGQTPPAGGKVARGNRVVPVYVATVEHRELNRQVTVSGPVEPVRIVAVSSQMAGVIRRLNAQEGTRVRKGATIAALDAREVGAQLARARATLANAQSRHDRTRLLLDRKLATDAEFEQALSDLNVAQSDVKLWQTRVGFTNITAPASGVVTTRLTETGGTVAANQKIFEIADLSSLVIRPRVSDLDVVNMRVGDRVAVSVDAFPGAEVEGRIRRIFPSADGSRLVPVEVEIGRRPPGVELRPGYLARITFNLQHKGAVRTIPSAAIALGDEGPFVFVVQGDSLVRRAVRPGISSNEWSEILDGLDVGESVVVGGQSRLKAGTRVRSLPFGQIAAPTESRR